MNLIPIGIIHSPHQGAEGTPIQAALATGERGTVEVFPDYAAGLRDLDGFERIWLAYWFDRAKPAELVVTPCLDTTPRGLFATRAPRSRSTSHARGTPARTGAMEFSF